ncbi:hypothetical protein [Halorubrum sp. DTA98]|uniref:hypothetical protein n=1 Tax=Halorubrum sp. DTA98 TaxID=3402163 RepID=UPI003AAFA320
MDSDGIGFVAAVFVIVGVGVGIVALAATGWAESAFVTDATGDAERFGPVFLAQLYLSVTVAALVVAPALAAVTGVLVGSRAYGHTEAATTCGIGAGIGALGYGLVVVAFVVGSQGSAAGQAYGVVETLGPVGATVVASAIVGSVTGVLGSTAG